MGVWKQVRLGVSEDSNVHEELEKLSSPLAFNLKTLYTHMDHMESGIVTRRSVLVTEAKGNGLHVGAFLNNRFSNTRRFPANETIQIIFKVFKYVLKLQLDTLESEGAVLGDLHEQNITVMGGETREGPEGRVPGAEKLTFAVVDCSGTLPVMNRPASELTRSKNFGRSSQLLSELLGHSQILQRAHLWLCL